MNISATTQNINAKYGASDIKTNFTEKISSEEASEIRMKISENAKEMVVKSTSLQASIVDKKDVFTKNYEEFQSFLQNIGYDSKPIAELSQEEASELVADDGIFGIEQTSQRIADFVINGSGGNEDLLRAGREGMLQGFKEAESLWGGELPEISQKTMQAAIEMVDKAMSDLGFSIIDQEA